MELYTEILKQILSNTETQVTFPNLHLDAKEIVDSVSYQALVKIKHILEDDTLQDQECFQKIEEIVYVFEELGSDGGNRHDFA